MSALSIPEPVQIIAVREGVVPAFKFWNSLIRHGAAPEVGTWTTRTRAILDLLAARKEQA